MISRDPGGALADGARQGAPQVIQVADRFHLLKNLGDAVERVLRRHANLVQQVAAPDSSSLPTDLLRPDRRASRERVRQEMAQRFAAIQRLKALGRSLSATARELGWHCHTVQQDWSLETAPQRRYTRRGSGHWPPMSRISAASGHADSTRPGSCGERSLPKAIRAPTRRSPALSPP